VAHIMGLTYIASDRVFAVDESGGGHVNEQSASLSATSSPISVGQLIAADHRVYVASESGLITLFRGLTAIDTPASTFDVGEQMLWSLAHADGVLYAGTGTGVAPTGSMVALDDTTGDVLWSQEFGGAIMYPASVAYSGSAPSCVIFGTAGQDQHVRALDVTSGTEVWDEPDYAFGQYVRGQVVYYADIDDNSLRARSVDDGSLIWEYVNQSNFNFQRPTFAGGVIYSTSVGNQVVSLDAATGNLLWEAEVTPHPGNPVTYFDHDRGLALLIFAIGQYDIGDSYLQALDANSGAVVWTSTTSVGGEGESCTDPIIADWDEGGMVQVGTPDGRLVSLDVADGHLVWQLQLTNEDFISRPKWAPW
jgi:outer membrane protein assembly factor BamB